jgi:hypothetical protein
LLLASNIQFVLSADGLGSSFIFRFAAQAVSLVLLAPYCLGLVLQLGFSFGRLEPAKRQSTPEPDLLSHRRFGLQPTSLDTVVAIPAQPLPASSHFLPVVNLLVWVLVSPAVAASALCVISQHLRLPTQFSLSTSPLWLCVISQHLRLPTRFSLSTARFSLWFPAL